MALDERKHAVGIFADRQRAIRALNELAYTDFPMNKIFVITKNSDNSEKQLGSADTSEFTITPSEGATLGAVRGGTTGGLLALIGGLTVLLIPGFGPALAAESILATFLASGASATAGGLVGALRGWFLPEEQAKFYDEQVGQQNYLVTVEGTESEMRHAEAVLNSWAIQEWRVFDAPTA